MVRLGVAFHQERTGALGHSQLFTLDLAPGQECGAGQRTAVRAVAVEREHEATGLRLVRLGFDLERRRSGQHEEELVVFAVDVRCRSGVLCSHVDDGNRAAAVGLCVVDLEAKLQPGPEGEYPALVGPENASHRESIPALTRTRRGCASVLSSRAANAACYAAATSRGCRIARKYCPVAACRSLM